MRTAPGDRLVARAHWRKAKKLFRGDREAAGVQSH
jgi:hypothetical protein